MTRPVHLHVGLKKTGTSYLQGIFWASQEELERQGLSLVPATQPGTFHLMLDVRGRYRPHSDPPAVATAVDRLPRQLAAMRGDRGLVTEESLAAARPAEIDRLAAALDGHEVHLVLTLRDLARQVPSAWQQVIQAGGDVGYDEFLDDVLARRGRLAGRFWRAQDVADVLARWGRLVPPERIHVVTVPPPGSAPGLLLDRFCRVLGVDASRLETPGRDDNVSLGRVQCEVLRRVNAALPPEARERQHYGDAGKRWLARQVLAVQAGDRTLVPRRLEPWCREQATATVAALESGGYDVVGDLADLQPPESAFTDADQAPPEPVVAQAATAALATVLEQRIRHHQTARRRRRRAEADSEPPPTLSRALRRLTGRSGR